MKIKSVLYISAAVCCILCGCNSENDSSCSSAAESTESITENEALQRIEIAEQSMNVEPETQEQTLERLTPIGSLLSEKEQDETEAFEEKPTEAAEYAETEETAPETEPQSESAETEPVTREEAVQKETEITKEPQLRPVG